MDKPEQLTAPIAFHGEGPVWWQANAEMRFVDMLRGKIFALTSSGEVKTLDVKSKVAACIRPRTTGGAIVAREHDIAISDDEDLSDIRSLTGAFIDSSLRFNEGGCDPDGNFYAGNMGWTKTLGAASLYQIKPDGSFSEVLNQITTSNGLDFSPDHRFAYYNDTETMRTDIFDYDSINGLHNRRPFIKYQPNDGRPDGLCVDEEGGIWVAMNRAGHIRRYSAAGTLETKIDLPVTMTTALSFGGQNLDTLYVTTSRNGLAQGDEPEAGSLFSIKPGVRGLVPLAFKG